MAIRLPDWIRHRNLLAGIVLSLAILDHTRLFFHFWNTKPADLIHPDLALFFTRFSAHFFAPAVFLLCGIELYMKGAQRSKAQNARLWIRNGIALFITEALFNNFLYTFDPYYRTLGLYIIGIMGLSMIILALLQYLPLKVLAGVAFLVLSGHNLLDQVTASGHSAKSIAWYILHEQKYIPEGDHLYIVNYTLLPWMALLCLGYTLGHFIHHVPQDILRKRAIYASLALCILFFLLRSINVYGDPTPWALQTSASATLISYFNVTKYPASLDYLCITIGPLLLLFAFTLRRSGNLLSQFFSLLGSMPLTVYLTSTLIIHLSALFVVELQGLPWQSMIITPSSYAPGSILYRYGFPLAAVYGIWILMLAIQYLTCKTFQTLYRRYLQPNIQQ